MHSRLAFPISLVAAFVLGSSPTHAQKAPSILESYQRARALLELAVNAHGGVDALRAARVARVQTRGWDYHPTQSRRVAPPFDSTVRNVDAMLDLDRGRIVYQQVRGWPGGFHYTNRFVTNGDSSFFVAPRNENYSLQSSWPRADQQYGNLFTFPQWYVLAAYESENPGARRYLGRLRTCSGAEVEAIAYPVPPSGHVVIGLDPQSHRLRAVMSVGSDVFTGDTEVCTEFLDWKLLGDMLLPTRSVQTRGGHVTSVQNFVAADAGFQIPDSLLRPPAHFTVAPANPQAQPAQELAPGVWLVGTGSKSLVVAFNDHLVVVDAPASGSADVITRAATLAPGKPIRYIVPTHHHDDHFSGVRFHVRNGATIVTTPGNTEYLRRMMTAPMSSVMSPRNQAPPKSDYKAETITAGKRVFSDGARTLEIHQIGSPHAEEMLVAWLPSEGILFQADLIEAPQAGVALRGANAETTTHLAGVIREKGWDVRTFAGAHATMRSPAEFASLVKLPIIPPGP
jgi:glyoxylase-like metal-dependent hydrolase (beta-lactamase superfamily II)